MIMIKIIRVTNLVDRWKEVAIGWEWFGKRKAIRLFSFGRKSI